ncbi:helix-turn-helix domain-containing protein [Nocardia sp. NPDC052001]|uniref:helix-turn-helix domain-containing protein n=1 Tax=Nocardia sp. NPDC052001 TaxID=3154853 RepID=UPI003448CBBF
MNFGGTGTDSQWDFAAAAPADGAAMIGYRDLGTGGMDLRVAGTAAVTLVVEFGGRGLSIEDAAGPRRLGGFIAGLGMDAMRVGGDGVQCVEVRLSPARAYSVLGISPRELGREVVDLEDLWGGRALLLREELAARDSWRERFALTETFLAQRDRPLRTPDPEVLAGWARILGSGGQVRVGTLAESVGWSYKRLWGRFESQIGLTPKRAAMLVRFRAAVDGLLAGRAAADVAATCGYVDQAHLCRDVSMFADRTPGSLAVDYLPAIAEQRYRAWGRFVQDRAGALGP